jgi:hypothetical protein
LRGARNHAGIQEPNGGGILCRNLPVSERFTKFDIEAYAVKKPMNWKKGSGVNTALGIAAMAAKENFLLGVPTPALLCRF